MVAAGLSFVIPKIFVVCPGRGGVGNSGTSLESDPGFSREFLGEVRLAVVESVTAFLACIRRAAFCGVGDGGKKAGCFSGEVPGDVRKLVSATAICTGTCGFFSFSTGPACFTVVVGLGGEMSKDSMTLVSATETSPGGGILNFILITPSSRSFSCNWPEETVMLPCRPKLDGSLVFGGYTAELMGDVGRTPLRRILFFGGGLGLPPLSLGRLLVRPGIEVSNLGDSIGEVGSGARSTILPLPFDFSLVDLVGPASASLCRRFPRSGDSSTGVPGGGLAGVEDATGLKVSIGEDWMILSVGATRFGLVNTILRGDKSFGELETAGAG